MQHCYGTVCFIIYNTDSKSLGYYSTVDLTFKSCVTTKTQPTYESINSVWKQEAQLLLRDHAMCNVNPNLNPNHSTNQNDRYSTRHNPNVNQLMNPH